MFSINRIFSLLLVFSLTFYSCENEPVPPDLPLNIPTTPPGEGGGEEVPEADVVGTWEVSNQTITITQEIDTEIEGLPINANQTVTAEYQSGDVVIVISEDGTYTSNGQGTYVISGNQDGIDFEETEEILQSGFASGTWSIANGNVTFTSNGSSVSYVITAFGGNSMTLYTDDDLPSYDNILNAGGIPDITNIPGYEDFDFDVEQFYEDEVSLTKVE